MLRQVGHRKVAHVFPTSSMSVKHTNDAPAALAHVGRDEKGPVLIHLIVHSSTLVTDESKGGMVVTARRSKG